MPSRRARSACRCARVRRPVSMSKSRLRAAATPSDGAGGMVQRSAQGSLHILVIGSAARASPTPRQELADRQSFGANLPPPAPKLPQAAEAPARSSQAVLPAPFRGREEVL